MKDKFAFPNEAHRSKRSVQKFLTGPDYPIHTQPDEARKQDEQHYQDIGNKEERDEGRVTDSGHRLSGQLTPPEDRFGVGFRVNVG